MRRVFAFIIIGLFSILAGCNDVNITNISDEKNDFISYYAVNINGIQKPIKTLDKNFYVYDYGKFEYAVLTDSGEKKDLIKMQGSPAIFESDNTYKVSGEYTLNKITIYDPYTGKVLIVFNNVYIIRFGGSSMFNKFIDCDSGKRITTVNIPVKVEKKTIDEIKNSKDNLIIQEKLQGKLTTSEISQDKFSKNELKPQERKKDTDYSELDSSMASKQQSSPSVINNITINNKNGQ